ncbi:MAG: hypothetical protein LIO65_09535 [Odoribacter sp.]|nr:hypothetical protein [Odoribacter sp.]
MYIGDIGKKTTSQPTFHKRLEELGYEVRRSTGGTTYVFYYCPENAQIRIMNDKNLSVLDKINKLEKMGHEAE